MGDAVAKPLPLGKPFTAAPGTYFIALLLNGNWATNALTLKSTVASRSTPVWRRRSCGTARC